MAYAISYIVLFLLIVPSLVVIHVVFSKPIFGISSKEWSLDGMKITFLMESENGFNDWMSATWTSVKVAINNHCCNPIGTMAALA